MRRALITIALTLCTLLCALSAYPRSIVTGYCSQGGEHVRTGPSQSSTFVMRTYPLATVDVYLQGTTTHATIFTNIGGTPQSNPMTADIRGAFQFYGDDAVFDVRCSGSGIVAPFIINNFLAPQAAIVLSVFGRTGAVSGSASDLTNGVTGSGAIALAVSPTFTGAPLAPTAAPGTNTTQIATTAYTTAAIAAAPGQVPTTRNLTVSSPITGGGTLAADRNFACPTCAVTGTTITATSPLAGSGSLAANMTLTCTTCAVTNGANNFTVTQLPNADNAIDLGSGAKRWANSHVNSVATGTGSLGTPAIHPESASAMGLYWGNGVNTIGFGTSNGTGGILFTIGTGALRTITWPNADTSIPIIPQTITVTGPTLARTWTVPDQNFTVPGIETVNNFTANNTITYSGTSNLNALNVQTTNALDTSPALQVASASTKAISASSSAANALVISGTTSGSSGLPVAVDGDGAIAGSIGVRGRCTVAAATCIGGFFNSVGTGVSSFGLAVTGANAAPTMQISTGTGAPSAAIEIIDGQTAGTKVLNIQNVGTGTSKFSISNDSTTTVGGTISRYNGQDTAGQGVVPIRASVALTAQAASIGSTSLHAVLCQTTSACIFRVCWVQQITQAATSTSSLLTTISWNNAGAKSSTLSIDYAAGTSQTTADASNTLNSERGNCIVMRTANLSGINYSTTYASTGGTVMQYSLDLTAERIR